MKDWLRYIVLLAAYEKFCKFVCFVSDTKSFNMRWRQIVNWFRDFSLRNQFIKKFNDNAQVNFRNLSVNALLRAKSCAGDPSPDFRHEMSAPVIASGFALEVIAGEDVPQDDIILIGQTILYNESVVRWLWALHWDTLIVKDIRSGNSCQWAIKEFIHLGGLLCAVQHNFGFLED